jgi:hypothetical protein
VLLFPSSASDGRERLALLEGQFLHEGHKAGLVVKYFGALSPSSI